jgi:kynurenine formamidase
VARAWSRARAARPGRDAGDGGRRGAGLTGRVRRLALATAAGLAAAAACERSGPGAGGAAPGEGSTPSASAPIDLSAYDLVDLTHAFDARTLYWPTSPTRFDVDTLAYGLAEGGYFYSSMAFSTPEHGGTHLDAPMHFAEGANASDQIPLERLIGPAVVIDVTAQAAADRDYRLTREDVLAWEHEHGAVPAGALVLLRTGWSRHWPDARAYLGDDTPGDASRLSFPSYGEDSARLLVDERRVGALGADVASIDYGRSTDFMVHRVAGAANVPGFENLTGLDRLPATGALLIALPVKIGGGTGGPLRAVALVPR